jgi:protein involved in polysaccharide export with SLBB domain
MHNHMILRSSSKLIAGGFLVFGLAGAGVAGAQSRTPSLELHNFASRSDLEAEAQAAEAGGRTAEAQIIRHRLSQGDFQEGDRVLVTVRGPGGFSDTLTVRSGPQLELPQVAPLPLAGVLRSELLDKLTAHISQFIRDPIVSARPLLRVGILGDVGHPGYYYASADLPLSDVLMVAGGPSTDADLTKVEVRRGGQTLLGPRETHAALGAGRSMDMLHMQAGDEITVGRQRQFNWPIIVSSATAVLGLLIAISQH